MYKAGKDGWMEIVMENKELWEDWKKIVGVGERLFK